MKASIQESVAINSLPFPKLMQDPATKDIWLLNSQSTGIRVFFGNGPQTISNHPPGNTNIGGYHSCLPTSAFVDYPKAVSLSN